MTIQYDSSGFLTSYLFLALLLPATILLIINSHQHKLKINCNCNFCSKKVKRSSWKNKKYILPCLILCALLIKNILTLKFQGSSNFNPYEILNIDDSATPRQIKSAYRRKMKQYDPDLFEGDDRKKVDEMSILINKAYQLLSEKTSIVDEDIKEEVFAMPKTLHDYGNLVLTIYILILGIYVPITAYKRWHHSQKYNRLGVTFDTMEKLYERIDSSTTISSLISILADCQELQYQNSSILDSSLFNISSLQNSSTQNNSLENNSFSHKNDIPDLKGIIESRFAVPIRDSEKMSIPHLILFDHLFRLGYFNDSSFIKKTLCLINGMKRIATAKNLPEVLYQIFNLEKMIIQGVFDPTMGEMQLPFINFEDLFLGEDPSKRLTGNQKMINEKVKDLIPTIEIVTGEIITDYKNTTEDNTTEDATNMDATEETTNKDITEETGNKIATNKNTTRYNNKNSKEKSTHETITGSKTNKNTTEESNLKESTTEEIGKTKESTTEEIGKSKENKAKESRSKESKNNKDEESKIAKENSNILEVEKNTPFTFRVTLKRPNKILGPSYKIGDGPSDQGFALKGKVDSNELLNSFGTYQKTLLHSYLSFDKFLEWNVMVEINDKIFYNQIADFIGIKMLYYTMNIEKNSNIKISVYSNGYFENDISEIFLVKVK